MGSYASNLLGRLVAARPTRRRLQNLHPSSNYDLVADYAQRAQSLRDRYLHTMVLVAIAMSSIEFETAAIEPATHQQNHARTFSYQVDPSVEFPGFWKVLLNKLFHAHAAC